VVKAARMYLALRRLIAERGANSLAIDCLIGLEYGAIPLSHDPCIVLFMLNDERYVAV